MRARRACAASDHSTTPEVLNASLPAGATALVVALSGGADSMALLGAAIQWREQHAALPVRAVHVDHGLQPAAAAFREACIAVCARCSVPLTVLTVEVALPAGASVEEAAREARYAALAAELRQNECLLTAHHARDQAETLLLQTLRGAGPKGMAAMPACREFGAGWHLRPFLNTTRDELLKFGAFVAAEHRDDPMNADLRFDRAYLRDRVWPSIHARWPGADIALARAARHAAEAQELLDASAADDLVRLRDGEALSVQGLRCLEPLRRFNVVRLWLREFGVEAPSSARLQEALRQVLDAQPDHVPVIAWGAHALRRYRQRLFLTAAQVPRLDGVRAWRVGSEAPLALGAGLGQLRWVQVLGGIEARHAGTELRVSARAGGETLKTGAGASTHTLKQLCQAHGVLPWMRAALPLLHAGDVLVGVADLWLETTWCAANVLGFAPAWSGGPILS